MSDGAKAAYAPNNTVFLAFRSNPHLMWYPWLPLWAVDIAVK